MDIFRKFDMLLNQELSFVEFRGFYECLNLKITEEEFQSTILSKYASSEKGITLKGFKEFFRQTMLKKGTQTVWSWFELLGYDKDLVSIRSRCFVITLHSDIDISVTVRDAIQTDLDNRVNIMLIKKFGKEMNVKTGKGVRAFYLLER